MGVKIAFHALIAILNIAIGTYVLIKRPRYIAYVLTLFAIAAIFFAVEFIIENFYFDDQIVDIFTGMIGGLLFNGIRKKFEALTDLTFFRKEYNYETELRNLGLLLDKENVSNLSELAHAIDRFLMVTVKPEHCVIVVATGDAPVFCKEFLHDAVASVRPTEAYLRLLDNIPYDITQLTFVDDGGSYPEVLQLFNISVVIPLGLGEGRAGAIFLGKKLSGAAFDAKDKTLLAVLGNQVGMTVRNVLLYGNIEYQKNAQESQTRFLTDIAHELQTPVAILKANTEIISRKAIGDRKTSLRVIEMTIDRMAQMITSLLAAARLNFSKEELHKAPVEMHTMLEEIYGDCLALVEEKGVALFFSSEQALVLGDRGQLKAVILNLISNALKHTPRGGNITLRGESGGVGAVRVTVADTGRGIPKENLDHLFERFYRIRGDVAMGTGLGLDICKKIIEAHGGSITVQSVEGEGSSFIITLPSFVDKGMMKEAASADLL